MTLFMEHYCWLIIWASSLFSATPAAPVRILTLKSMEICTDLCAYTVYADSEEITTTTDILSAITVCFVLYWIFNIQYPKQFYGLLSFLDIFIFHRRSVKPSQKVSSFINKF